LVATGCFPVPDPPWLVGQDAELLAVRADVVEEGALSIIVAPTPADRVRVDALPGDTIAFRPFVIDRERVWPEAELDVAYFACFGAYSGACTYALRSNHSVSTCTGVAGFDTRVCRIGQGPDARLVAPTASLEEFQFIFPSILAVAGRPGVVDTDTCVDALRDWPDGELADCMLLERQLGTGPNWVLSLFLAGGMNDDGTTGDSTSTGDDATGETGDTDTAGVLDPYAPPPEVFLEWPNFNPEVERFTVEITRSGERRSFDHVSGDHIRVRAGDTIVVTHERDPRDAQSFVIDETPIGLQRTQETLFERWYSTHALSPFTDVPGDQTVRWEVPSDVAAYRVDVLLSDFDTGYGWGSLYFEVDGAAP
jgi:hypothetical protein